MNKNSKTTAFTLAEVLITLGIIGVVAAVSLPTIITNINERRNSERQANIAQKITQAMEQMRAHGLLNTQYPTTEAFVDELQKYLKITKRCDKDHLTECWPTETVIDATGEEYNVAEAQTGEHLNRETTTNNVGLILADGASIILNYDNSTEGIDVGDRVRGQNKNLPVGRGQEKNFPYTTSVTSAVDFVMDVNGRNKPNKEKDSNNKLYDIRSFKTASFTKINPCEPHPDSFYIPDVGCVVKKGTGNWNTAVSICNAIGHLTSFDELYKIYNQKGKISDVPIDGRYWTSEFYQTPWSAAHYRVINFPSDNISYTSGDHDNGSNCTYCKIMCVYSE